MTEPGNNTKLIAIAVLLLIGAGALIFMVLPKEAPPPPPQIAEVKTIKRAPAMEPQIEIPEEVPDAGVVDAAPEKVKVRYVRNSWDCAGEIDKAAIKAIIGRNRRQVQSCYERELRSNNMLAGRLILRARVDAKGNVTSTQTGGSLRDGSVTSCVRRVASSWKFPAPKGGSCAVVEAPFHLTPKS